MKHNIPLKLLSLLFFFILYFALLTPSVLANSWTNKGNLQLTRSYHTATLLSDGKVFVIGGTRNGYSIYQSEIYNPSTGNWSYTSLQYDVKFQYHTANLVTVNNTTGATKVLVAGGIGNGGPATNSAVLYNPVANSWSTSNMLTTRMMHASSLLDDGRALLTGGYTGYSTVTSSTEIYDPIANGWTIKANLNNPRRNHAQITYTDSLGSSKAMVIGGVDTSGSTLTSTEIYDPSTNTWSYGPNLNHARSDFAAVLMHDGRILVVGGDSPDFDKSEVYDPSTNSWITYSTYYKFRNNPSSVAVLGSGAGYRVLAAGGNACSSQNAQLFDPSMNSWSAAASMNVARCRFSLITLNDGSALAAGGLGSLGSINSSELYSY